MRKKKAVLQINAVYGKGSTGEISKDISAVALECGWDSYVACSIKPSGITKETSIFLIGNLVDHKLHAMFSRLFGLQGYYSHIATYVFLKKIDAISPDIIHIHNIHSNYLNMKMLFRYIKRKKIPTIISLHDCWYYTGKCYHYLYDNCSRWQEKCGRCPRLKKEIPSYLCDCTRFVLADREKYIGNNPYVYVVGVSDWITSEARKSVLKSRVFGTIHNGVDLSVFSPKKDNLRDELQLTDKFVILGMANKWLLEDNIDTLRYITEKIDQDSALVLIGCKRDSKLPVGVIGIPFVKDRNLLASYYSMADVFVNVTKVDTLPTVNIESIACGTPVVTYNSGGSAEIVDGETGYAVPYGDYKELFRSIELVKKNEKKHYSASCVARSHAKFDNRNCYKEYVSLYENILKNT